MISRSLEAKAEKVYSLKLIRTLDSIQLVATNTKNRNGGLESDSIRFEIPNNTHILYLIGKEL